MSSSNTSLVLRVCRPDGTSRDGFQWPMKVGAEVVAPDWKNNTECGNGLHGWLYGQGDYGCVSYWEDDEAKWLVLEVESDGIDLLGGNCKFPRAVVRFVGTRAAAADYIIVNEPRAHSSTVIGACLKAGEGEVVQVGSLGTAMAGDYGKAIAGGFGKASVGQYGNASVGYKGESTAGLYGTAAAGLYGEIRIQWWDNKAQRYRIAVAYVGENGIKPNVAYKLDDNHNFVEANK